MQRNINRNQTDKKMSQEELRESSVERMSPPCADIQVYRGRVGRGEVFVKDTNAPFMKNAVFTVHTLNSLLHLLCIIMQRECSWSLMEANTKGIL